MNLEQLYTELKETFPLMWLRHENDKIITGEGSFLKEYSEALEEDLTVPLFDYWDEREIIYEMGVHKTFRRFLEERGFWIECYDPGTYWILKD